MRLTLIAGALTAALASPALAAGLSPLIEPAQLAARDDVTILDLRTPHEFATAHIGDAVNTPYSSWRGPADNPGQLISDEALTALLNGAGLDHEDRIVITYAGVTPTDFGAAARVYWTLKSAGFPDLSILNGGVRAWVEAGQRLSAHIAPVTPSTGTFAIDDTYLATGADVAAIAGGERDGTLIDARPAPFFAGAAKHPAARSPGTIAGATSVPFEAFFGGDEPAISGAEEARAIAANAPASTGETVSFCNTGHWAATNWFALSELAGRDNVKLYAESMVGWLSDGNEAVAGN